MKETLSSYGPLIYSALASRQCRSARSAALSPAAGLLVTGGADHYLFASVSPEEAVRLIFWYRNPTRRRTTPSRRKESIR